MSLENSKYKKVQLTERTFRKKGVLQFSGDSFQNPTLRDSDAVKAVTT